jgi:NAD(P)-dependent dehydrogenase (short-subunit alcohol dehydrogenase family)
VVLVVGAGDGIGRAAALHLSAHGAAVVLAGPRLDDVVEAAGLVAAAGGTVRVVETPCPPLDAAGAVAAATAALDRPTDAVLHVPAFASDPAARAFATLLSPLLPAGARVEVLAAVPFPAERQAAERLARSFAPPSETRRS